MASAPAQAQQRGRRSSPSLDPERPQGARELGKVGAARAIAAAKTPACTRFRGTWLISERTGRAYPQQCRAWRCPHCAKVKKAAASVRIERGLEAAAKAGRRVRLMTFTDTGAGDMTIADLAKAWDRLRGRLRRRGLLGEYFAVVELQARGALHLHLLMAESDRGGKFVAQDLLVELAIASGFGEITDIRLVQAAGDAGRSMAEYLSKGGVSEDASKLADYLTKSASGESLADKSAERVRPARASQGWLADSQRDLEAEVRQHFRDVAQERDGDVDDGPFTPWRESDLAQLLELFERAAQRPGDAPQPPRWLILDSNIARGPPKPSERAA